MPGWIYTALDWILQNAPKYLPKCSSTQYCYHGSVPIAPTKKDEMSLEEVDSGID